MEVILPNNSSLELKDETICRQMANRLRNDYSDYYYRIICLFKKNGYSFKDDYYHFLKETTAENLTFRFRSLQQDTFLPVAETPNSGTVMKDSYCQRRSMLCRQYLENTTRDVRSDSSPAQTLLKDIFHFEDQITSITDTEFSALNATELYQQEDTNSVAYLDKDFNDVGTLCQKQLVCTNHFRRISSRFDWSFLDDSFCSIEDRIKRVVSFGQSDYQAVLVAECTEEGFSLYYIDEIDNILLEALQSAKPIDEVAETITGAYEIADAEEIKFIESVVRQRNKRGIHRKLFKIDTSRQEPIIA